MKCPLHAAEMQEQTDDGIMYNECPECAGIWLTHRAMRTIAERDSAVSVVALPKGHAVSMKNPDKDDNNVTECPLDGARVYEHKYGSVTIDVCPECDGIWLDPGELEKIREELAETTRTESVVEAISGFFAMFKKGE